MNVTVYVPSQLHSYTGAPMIEVEGATLGEVLDALDVTFPGLRFRVIDEQNP